MPGGQPLQAGQRVVNAAYADTLRLIVQGGSGALYGGALGDALADDMARHGDFITQADLRGYRTHDKAVLRAMYRGFEITGPSPPCAGPPHIGQMLQILEGFGLAASGFGSLDNLHRLAEVLKIAFADLAAATAAPDFVPVPVARLLSADYAAQRHGQIDPARPQAWAAGVVPGGLGNESANTTHLTVADADGRIVSATQTINSLFGAPEARGNGAVVGGRASPSSLTGPWCAVAGLPSVMSALSDAAQERSPMGAFPAVRHTCCNERLPK